MADARELHDGREDATTVWPLLIKGAVEELGSR